MFGPTSATGRDQTPSVVREAWRARLQEDFAQQAAQRQRQSAIYRTVLIGVLIGIIGSVVLHFIR